MKVEQMDVAGTAIGRMKKTNSIHLFFRWQKNKGLDWLNNFLVFCFRFEKNESISPIQLLVMQVLKPNFLATSLELSP
mgnify:CR=1 FL=1